MDTRIRSIERAALTGDKAALKLLGAERRRLAGIEAGDYVRLDGSKLDPPQARLTGNWRVVVMTDSLDRVASGLRVNHLVSLFAVTPEREIIVTAPDVAVVGVPLAEIAAARVAFDAPLPLDGLRVVPIAPLIPPPPPPDVKLIAKRSPPEPTVEVRVKASRHADPDFIITDDRIHPWGREPWTAD